MTEEKAKTSKYTNLEPNIAAALSYIISPFTGIVFFVVEKDDKFVRFHAFQSILFGIASYIIWFITTSLMALLVGFVLVPLVSIAMFIFYALLMWKAYNNEMYELPVLGKIAKEQANK
ncbi:DUF4870 domain-containing protein [Patescibacteria group bacterium]